MRLKLAHSLLFFCLRTRQKKQNPLKNIAKCKFCDILKQHLSWHKARIDCLASIITALFVRQTVNLSALKNVLSSKTKPESIYRRMQRFFAGNLIGKTDVARFVFSVFGWQNVRLTLDRTTWEYGKSCINILVLAVI